MGYNSKLDTTEIENHYQELFVNINNDFGYNSQLINTAKIFQLEHS